MKKTLLLSALFCASLMNAQNTIANADSVDGTEDLNVTTQTLSYSGLSPTCSTRPDIFFKHDVSVGDNKVTIGLSVSPNASYPDTTVRVEILKAVGGDLTSSGLQEVSCLTFAVSSAGGGAFTEEIDVDVLDADDYFLRIYVPAGVGNQQLTTLVNSTDITMTSEFDATLSQSELVIDAFEYSVLQNSIEISNAQKFKDIYVFDITGKKVMTVNNDQARRSIDISALRNGVYIMNLIGNDVQNKSVKFVKR